MFMFEIIDSSTFNQMFSGDNKPMDIFINYFKNKKSTTFLYWYVLEFVAPPFNYENKHDDIVKLENILTENDLKIFVIISGVSTKVTDDLKLNPIKNVEFLIWPTYLLHYSCYGLEKAYNKPISLIEIEKEFKNLYFNFNVKPKYHRGMLMDKLHQNDLFKHGKNSWVSNLNFKYDFKSWKEENLKIDDYNGNEFTGYYTEDFLKLNCLINVIGETLYNKEDIFITEKTYKSIIIKQPFICLSSQYFHKHLTNLGFKLYDEIFDYSFDDEFELEKRIDGIIKNLNTLTNENYYHLYEKIKDKLDYNKNRAIEIIKKDEYIPKELVTLYRDNKDVFHQNIDYNKVPIFLPNFFKNY